MSDWKSDLTWADVPELTLEQARAKVEAGATLIFEEETFEAVKDLCASMYAKGFSEPDIAAAIRALIDKARH